MQSLSVREVVEATRGVLVIGDPQETTGPGPGGVSTDSRSVKKGDVFFAIKGEKFDGHAYVNECLQKGAFLCVVSEIPPNLVLSPRTRFSLVKVKDTKTALADCARYYRLKYGADVSVAGVAGSCGKTTVKEMTARILGLRGPTVYSRGNFNNEIGCPLSLFAIEPHHRFGVFEIGSSSVGEVKRLAEVVLPRTAVVTNIRLEHTETFGTLENIAQGESEILGVLAEGGTAVLPRDDAFYEFLKGRIAREKKIRTVSFGLSDRAQVCARDIRVVSGPDEKFAHSAGPGPSRPGMAFTLVRRDERGGSEESFPCFLPVMGRFNVVNACAAAAAGLSMGASAEDVREALSGFEPVRMRFETLELGRGVTVVNDSYNANPGSMRASLESFAESFPGRKLCVVLSDMLELGEISRQEHYELGRYLAALPLSRVVLFGPQSRFVAEGAKDAFMHDKIWVYCADREALLREARACLQAGSAVLFKASRGMRLEEIVQKLKDSAV